jgi:hypothetical protein
VLASAAQATAIDSQNSRKPEGIELPRLRNQACNGLRHGWGYARDSIRQYRLPDGLINALQVVIPVSLLHPPLDARPILVPLPATLALFGEIAA